MATEPVAELPGRMMAEQDAQGNWLIYSRKPSNASAAIPGSGYFPIGDCEMGHHPFDAVIWWNQTGKRLPRRPDGGPGREIRDWMELPNNYQLQLSSHNRSAGQVAMAAGYFWVPPGTPD